MNKVFIYNSSDLASLEVKDKLSNLLANKGVKVFDEFNNEVELVISIGGDGTFLSTTKEINYSKTPILGINTGHLGFFAEYAPNKLDEVVDSIINSNFSIQEYKTIKTEAISDDSTIELDPAINDVFVKHGNSSIVHLDLYIGNEFIENFSGDGILVSSACGSTAYNYSLGGSIIDPRVNLLQITPVAPNNNKAYRSITSSLVVPGEEKIVVILKDENNTSIIIDGNDSNVKGVKKIVISLTNRDIHIVRRLNYSFWSKVRSKFL